MLPTLMLNDCVYGSSYTKEDLEEIFLMKNGNDYLGLFTDSIGYEDNFAQVSKYVSDNYVNSVKNRFITGEGATSNASLGINVPLLDFYIRYNMTTSVNNY